MAKNFEIEALFKTPEEKLIGNGKYLDDLLAAYPDNPQVQKIVADAQQYNVISQLKLINNRLGTLGFNAEFKKVNNEIQIIVYPENVNSPYKKGTNELNLDVAKEFKFSLVDKTGTAFISTKNDGNVKGIINNYTPLSNRRGQFKFLKRQEAQFVRFNEMLNTQFAKDKSQIKGVQGLNDVFKFSQSLFRDSLTSMSETAKHEFQSQNSITNNYAHNLSKSMLVAMDSYFNSLRYTYGSYNTKSGKIEMLPEALNDVMYRMYMMYSMGGDPAQVTQIIDKDPYFKDFQKQYPSAYSGIKSNIQKITKNMKLTIHDTSETAAETHTAATNLIRTIVPFDSLKFSSVRNQGYKIRAKKYTGNNTVYQRGLLSTKGGKALKVQYGRKITKGEEIPFDAVVKGYELTERDIENIVRNMEKDGVGLEFVPNIHDDEILITQAFKKAAGINSKVISTSGDRHATAVMSKKFKEYANKYIHETYGLSEQEAQEIQYFKKLEGSDVRKMSNIFQEDLQSLVHSLGQSNLENFVRSLSTGKMSIQGNNINLRDTFGSTALDILKNIFTYDSNSMTLEESQAILTYINQLNINEKDKANALADILDGFDTLRAKVTNTEKVYDTIIDKSGRLSLNRREINNKKNKTVAHRVLYSSLFAAELKDWGRMGKTGAISLRTALDDISRVGGLIGATDKETEALRNELVDPKKLEEWEKLKKAHDAALEDSLRSASSDVGVLKTSKTKGYSIDPNDYRKKKAAQNKIITIGWNKGNRKYNIDASKIAVEEDISQEERNDPKYKSPFQKALDEYRGYWDLDNPGVWIPGLITTQYKVPAEQAQNMRFVMDTGFFAGEDELYDSGRTIVGNKIYIPNTVNKNSSYGGKLQSLINLRNGEDYKHLDKEEQEKRTSSGVINYLTQLYNGINWSHGGEFKATIGSKTKGTSAPEIQGFSLNEIDRKYLGDQLFSKGSNVPFQLSDQTNKTVQDVFNDIAIRGIIADKKTYASHLATQSEEWLARKYKALTGDDWWNSKAYKFDPNSDDGKLTLAFAGLDPKNPKDQKAIEEFIHPKTMGKLRNKVIHALLPYLTVGTPEFINALVTNPDALLKDSMIAGVDRLPNINGAGMEFTDLFFAGSNGLTGGKNTRGMSLGSALAMSIKADFDGDRVGLKTFDTSNKDVEKFLIKGNEFYKDYHKKLNEWIQHNNSTDLTDEQKMLSAEDFSNLLNIDLQEASGLISRFNKQGLGLFSNISNEFTTRMFEAKLDEASLNENSTVEDLKRVGNIGILRAFFETQEQDILSSKKVVNRMKKIAKTTGTDYLSLLNEVSNITAKFFDFEGPGISFTDLISEYQSMGVLNDKDDELIGGKGSRVGKTMWLRIYEYLRTLKGDKGTKLAQEVFGVQSLDDLTKRDTISKDELLNAIDYLSSETGGLGGVNYSNRDEFLQSLVRNIAEGAKPRHSLSSESFAYKEGKTWDINHMSEDAKKWVKEGQKIINSNIIAERNNYGKTTSATALAAQVSGHGTHYSANELLNQLLAPYIEPNSHNKLTTDETLLKELKERANKFENLTDEERAQELGYGTNVELYRKEGSAYMGGARGTYAHSIAEALSQAKEKGLLYKVIKNAQAPSGFKLDKLTDPSFFTLQDLWNLSEHSDLLDSNIDLGHLNDIIKELRSETIKYDVISKLFAPTYVGTKNNKTEEIITQDEATKRRELFNKNITRRGENLYNAFLKSLAEDNGGELTGSSLIGNEVYFKGATASGQVLNNFMDALSLLADGRLKITDFKTEAGDLSNSSIIQQYIYKNTIEQLQKRIVGTEAFTEATKKSRDTDKIISQEGVIQQILKELNDSGIDSGLDEEKLTALVKNLVWSGLNNQWQSKGISNEILQDAGTGEIIKHVLKDISQGLMDKILRGDVLTSEEQKSLSTTVTRYKAKETAQEKEERINVGLLSEDETKLVANYRNAQKQYIEALSAYKKAKGSKRFWSQLDPDELKLAKKQFKELKKNLKEIKDTYDKLTVKIGTEGLKKVIEEDLKKTNQAIKQTQDEIRAATKKEQEKVTNRYEDRLNKIEQLKIDIKKRSLHLGKGSELEDFYIDQANKKDQAEIEKTQKELDKEDFEKELGGGKTGKTRVQEIKDKNEERKKELEKEYSLIEKEQQENEQKQAIEQLRSSYLNEARLSSQIGNRKIQSQHASPEMRAELEAQNAIDQAEIEKIKKEREEKNWEAQITDPEKLQEVYKDVALQTDNLAAAQVRLNKEMNPTVWDNMKKSFQGWIKSLTSGALIWTFAAQARRSINNIVQGAQKLDAVLTDLRIVTGDTREETKSLMTSYSKLGNELSASTSEVASAANSWLRQGYAISEVNDLISASMHLSKLGMIDSGKATEYLI